MLYKDFIIKEDKEILEGQNLSDLAKVIGYDRSYLSSLKNKRRIAPLSMYKKLKNYFEKTKKPFS